MRTLLQRQLPLKTKPSVHSRMCSWWGALHCSSVGQRCRRSVHQEREETQRVPTRGQASACKGGRGEGHPWWCSRWNSSAWWLKECFQGTISEHRKRQKLSRGSEHSVPPNLKNALKWGYISPNLLAPTGMQWRARGGRWSLFPQGRGRKRDLAGFTCRGFGVCLLVCLETEHGYGARDWKQEEESKLCVSEEHTSPATVEEGWESPPNRYDEEPGSLGEVGWGLGMATTVGCGGDKPEQSGAALWPPARLAWWRFSRCLGGSGLGWGLG